MSGVKDVFKYLKKNDVIISIVSNKYGKFTRDIAKHLDISKYVSLIFGEGDGYPIKPEPDMIISALKILDLSPVDVYYAGDTTVDMAAAKGAGVHFIGLPNGSTPKEDFVKLKPDLMLSDIERLKGIFNLHKMIANRGIY